MKDFCIKLDLQLFAGEKTEPATPKKREESREKGQVAKSAELPAAFILLFSFLCLMALGDFFKVRIVSLFTISFNDYMHWELSNENVIAIFGQLIIQGLILLSPLFVITMLIAILGNYLQIGFLLSGDPLVMKLSKLDPIEGTKRIFSLRSVIDFLKSIFKLLIISSIVYFTLWSQRSEIMTLSTMPLDSIFKYTASIIFSLGIKIAVLLVILAIFDYMYEKYDFEKNIKMSKQDIKDEYKKSEGDPLIKAKIKEKQRRMAMQRMMQEVPKADVIITNPTHYAIALQYETGSMEAPKVIAKGMDFMALKIKEIAKENNLTIVENKPLARTLYDEVDIGEAIPGDLFQAVAEVLAYVYKLKGKK